MNDELKGRAYDLLRKTEKYTKTDMVYLASGGFWLTLKTILSALLALGVSVAFANLISQETYGSYKYVFALFGILALPTLMGLGTSVVKSVAQGYEGTPMALLRAKVLWGLLGSLASVAVAAYYFLNGNMELAGAFAVVAAFLPFVDTFGIFSTLLTGKQLFKASVLYELVVQIVSSVAVVLALLTTDSLVLILAAYFASMTLIRLLVLRAVVRKYATNDRVDTEALGYGKHLSVLDVLGTAVEALDGILLWQFVGAAPLAVYSFAKAIPLQMAGGLKRIATLAFPRFATRDFESIRKALFPKLLLLFVFLVALTGAYVIAAPYLFALLFPAYLDAVPYTQLYALTLLLFPKKIIGTVFGAHGDTRVQYINSIATLSLKVVLALALIPPYGIMGALVAELIAQAASLVLITTLFIRAKTSSEPQ